MRLTPNGSYGEAEAVRDGQPVVGTDASNLAESMILFPYAGAQLRTGDVLDAICASTWARPFRPMTLHSTERFVGLGPFDAIGVAQLEETENLALADWPAQNGVALTNGQASVRSRSFIGLQDGWPQSGYSSMSMAFTASKTAGGAMPSPAVGRDVTTGTFTVHGATSYRLLP